MSSLEVLKLTRTKVMDISFLKPEAILPKLKTFYMRKTCVDDISALSGRTIYWLDLSGTPVKYSSALANVTKLSLTGPGTAEWDEVTGKVVAYSDPDAETTKHLAACNKAKLL